MAPLQTTYLEGKPSPYGGVGLYLKVDAPPGTVIHREAARFVCPVSMEESFVRFLSLNEAEMNFLGGYEVRSMYEFSERENEMLTELLRRLSCGKIACGEKFCEIRREGFRWFRSVLKSYAHAISESLPYWAMYEIAARANHSCVPNVGYKNVNGILEYVTLQPLRKGDEILVSYLSNVFGSHSYRQKKLRQHKLFTCACALCTSKVDLFRRIWCPHCRTQDEEEQEGGTPAFATYVIRSANNDPNIAIIQKMNNVESSSGVWVCSVCKMTYTENVMPVAVEGTLINLYEQLNEMLTRNAITDPSVFEGYLNYLHATTLNVLGPLHWLHFSSCYLLSRYNAGIWNGSPKDEAYIPFVQNAVQYGSRAAALANAMTPDHFSLEILPWYSVLMRLCLEAAQIQPFLRAAVDSLKDLRNLYGGKDNSVRAYDDCVVYLHQKDLLRDDCSTPLTESARTFLRKKAAESRRPTPDLREIVSTLSPHQQKWIPINANGQWDHDTLTMNLKTNKSAYIQRSKENEKCLTNILTHLLLLHQSLTTPVSMQTNSGSQAPHPIPSSYSHTTKPPTTNSNSHAASPPSKLMSAADVSTRTHQSNTRNVGASADGHTYPSKGCSSKGYPSNHKRTDTQIDLRRENYRRQDMPQHARHHTTKSRTVTAAAAT